MSRVFNLVHQLYDFNTRFPTVYWLVPIFFWCVPTMFCPIPRFFWFNCIDIQSDDTNKLWERTNNLLDTMYKS